MLSILISSARVVEYFCTWKFADAQQNEDGFVGNGIAPEGYSQISGSLSSDEDDPQLGHRPLSNGNVDAQDAAANGNQRAQGTVVNVNGIEITVFGNVAGLELLSLGSMANGGPEIHETDPHALDSEEEEEEERQRIAAENAIRQANEADLARRRAPLAPEQCRTIRNAMRGITLAGFRPDWADVVPEQAWINMVTGNRQETSGSSK